MSRRWRDLAVRDFAESVRDRSLHATAGLLALLGGGVGLLHARVSAGEVTGVNLLVLLTLGSLFLVPLAALTGGYESIVRLRRAGALKVVLGLPYSRTDVVLGAVLGRLGVILSATTALFVVGHLVALAAGGPVAPGTMVVVLAVTGLLGAAFVGVAVGVSAATRSSTRAAVLVFGFFLLALALWSQGLVRALVFLANGLQAPATRPEWANVVDVLNPLTAYRSVVAGLVPALSQAVFGGAPGPPGAVYRTPTFGALVLLGWAVLAPLAGLFRFRRSDL